MKIIIIFTILIAVKIATAEVVKFSECKNVVSSCTINEVRVNPCPEAAIDSSAPCNVKRGRSASIEFDYTPGFTANKLKGDIFWDSSEGLIPYVGMDPEACSYTNCPIEQNIKRTYSQIFNTSKKYPMKTFTIRWNLSNPAASANSTDLCCFTTKVKLIR